MTTRSRPVDGTPVVRDGKSAIDVIFAVLEDFLETHPLALGDGNCKTLKQCLSRALFKLFEEHPQVTMYSLVRKLGAHFHPELIDQFLIELVKQSNLFYVLAHIEKNVIVCLKDDYTKAVNDGTTSNRTHRDNHPDGIVSYDVLFPTLNSGDASTSNQRTQQMVVEELQQPFVENPNEFPPLPSKQKVTTPAPTVVVPDTTTTPAVVVPDATTTPVVVPDTPAVVVPDATQVVMPAQQADEMFAMCCCHIANITHMCPSSHPELVAVVYARLCACLGRPPSSEELVDAVRKVNTDVMFYV